MNSSVCLLYVARAAFSFLDKAIRADVCRNAIGFLQTDLLCIYSQVFLRDTDERACAYIAGAAPNRWGFTADGRDLNTLIEPVPPALSGEVWSCDWS